MNERQPNSPRRRLQELLAIPERQRTDDQWDEINELEIALSRVNQAETLAPNVRRGAVSPLNHPKPNGGAQNKKPFKKPRKMPPKENTP